MPPLTPELREALEALLGQHPRGEPERLCREVERLAAGAGREALLAERLVRRLHRVREQLERLPRRLADLAVVRPLACDDATALLLALDGRGGRHAVLLPAAPGPPAVRELARRAERVRQVPGCLPPGRVRTDPVPHLRIPLAGVALAEAGGLEDLAEEQLACLAGGAIAALAHLEGLGWWHGAIDGWSLWWQGDGVRLLWTGSSPPGATRGDLRRLAALLAPCTPPATPLEDLLDAWRRAPPPGARAAADLLRESLARSLAADRHALARARRRQVGAGRRARLLAAVRRLEAALPLPAMRVRCAGPDGLPWRLDLEGHAARGGPLGPDPAPVLADEAGIDPVAARAWLRAWARRRGAPPADVPAGEAAARWLRARLALRRQRLLLGHSSRRRG